MQRSRSPAARSFAQMMIGHHTRTSADMMAAAQRLGLRPPPPPQMLPPQMEAFDRIRSAGPEFDTMYKREPVLAHQQALDLHRGYALQGDVPPLRDLASRIVPIIQDHLLRAQDLPEYSPPLPPPIGQVSAADHGRMTANVMPGARRKRRRLPGVLASLAGALLALAAVPPAAFGQASPGEIGAAIRSGDFASREVRAFYAARGYRPLWITEGTAGPAADQLLQPVQTAQLDGLDPDDYRPRALARHWRAPIGVAPRNLPRPSCC